MAKTPPAGPTKRQIQGQLRDALENHKAIQDALQTEAKWYESIGDHEAARAKTSEQIAERQRMINELLANQNKLSQSQKDKLTELQVEQRRQIANEKEINAQLKKQEKTRKTINEILHANGKLIKEGLKYLMESDKVIKNTVLNLGMSGTKADYLRTSFEQSAGIVARMGGNLEDIQRIMEGYADETGRARVLSAEMVKDIAMIGKGTGLGIEQAAKLGAQFEYMGFDAKKTLDYVQGVVDTSERMGVNTTKVLKNLSDNFKKLNTFTFIRGSKAMAEMAMNSEKMKVNMADALNVAEATRGLEKIIELTANLQVMGGEFSKLDPFEALYMSRNEPEKWTEKISEMTRGLYTLRKTADGTFEKFIAPVDLDRLKQVAKSLGISEEEMVKIGQRRLDLDKMNQDMMSMGLTKREKELIQGAAVFNADSGKFQVMLAGKMRDISTLTADQAKSFAKEQKTLEARAKEAQTFDEVFKVTINELKATLLPLLRTINGVLEKIRPVVTTFVDWISKGPHAWIKVALLFMGVTTAMKLVGGMLSNISNGLLSKMPGIGRMGASAGASGAGAAGAGGGVAKTGGAMLKGGLGVGAAGLGIGAGIGVAAVGISKLADSMSKLTPEQGKVLAGVVNSLKTLSVVGLGVSIAIGLIGLAGSGAAVGLLAFGGAMLMVGGGVALATLGIGKMAQGFATMFTAVKGAGADMKQVAGGITQVVASLALAGLAMPNAIALGMSIRQISKHSDDLMKVGEAFRQINTVLSGSKDDYQQVAKAVESISRLNTKGGGTFSNLANILNKPLKVQFDQKEVALNTYVTLDVNGQKLHQAIGTTAYVTNNQNRAKGGLETIHS